MERPRTETDALARDLARLSEALWSAVDALDGEPLRELCDELERIARASRSGVLEGGRRVLAERVAALGDRELEDVARAFAAWCHLMNVAEDRQRLRILRAWGERPNDGVVAAVDAWIDAGAGEAEVQAWMERALVMPVLTAHPTEARRRSTLGHLVRISKTLDDLDASERSRIANALTAEVLALHVTEHTRTHRPSPLDEVEATLDVFRRSLLDVTPKVYRAIEDRCRARFGATFRVPPFLRWGSWVGGDRDGNPNVTADVARMTFARHRALALERHVEDVVRLGIGMSASSRRVASTALLDELDRALEADRARMPEVAARARPRTPDEPWREKLWYVHARLLATVARGDDAYASADEYRGELLLLDRTLRAVGFDALADHDLRDAIRRAEVFGFHLASLDLREHSGVHETIVAELLATLGRDGYRDLDEPARHAMLSDVLAHPIAPIRDVALSKQTRDVLALLEVVGRARRDLGARACERYVISFAHDVSDLLEVVLLCRAAGLAPGEIQPVPLLEQLGDLERAGAIARDVLADPTLRGELRDRFEVMLGYSDSGKQVGLVASTVALQRAQLELVEVVDRSAVMLTVFHGRGGALGRGGGPAGQAIRAQPPAAVRGRLRVTEQGETVTARYAHPEIAERDLEQALAAVFDVGRYELEQRGVDGRELEMLATAAEAARRAYAELTRDEDRLARYTLRATPIDFVSHLPIGSRPATRRPGLALAELRAIPWVFSWTQSRHGVPGWFGIGTAIEAMCDHYGVPAARELVTRSRFVRALIENCELSLVRSDIDVAREYARLADPSTAPVFDIIAAEHARTVRALRELLGRAEPASARPYLAASVARRNPAIDVLSHVQIEALRRRRANRGDGERLDRVIFTTLGGIAAGLQTVG